MTERPSTLFDALALAGKLVILLSQLITSARLDGEPLRNVAARQMTGCGFAEDASD
jgi:hypothetical protein